MEAAQKLNIDRSSINRFMKFETGKNEIQKQIVI